MIKLPRPTRMLLLSIAISVAVLAAMAPSALAETTPSIWLNEQTGVLAITGTDVNDAVAVTRQASASAPGGYVLVINSKSWPSADFSASCTEGGAYGDWNITCPALNSKRITFDGEQNNDSFTNNTSLPSVAYGGPGIDFLTGGSGSDTFY